MATVMERVQKVLRMEFSPQEIILQPAGGGMVGGWIISESFEELNEVERQQKVWKLFETFLNENERDHIVGFLTFTPLEKRMAFDDDFDEFETPVKQKASSKRARKPVATKGHGVMRRKIVSKGRQTAAVR